jgi:hypothetical protein
MDLAGLRLQGILLRKPEWERHTGDLDLDGG